MSDLRSRLEEVKAKGVFGSIPMSDVHKYTGLELLSRVVDGTYPPPSIGGALDFVISEIEEGRAVFVGWPGKGHMNPMGTVHGGWAATILDSALACAVHTTCGKGEVSTTVEFKVNLVRPIIPDMGELTCEGKVIHRGRSLAVSEAILKGPDGKTLAIGTETCSFIKIPAT